MSALLCAVFVSLVQPAEAQDYKKITGLKNPESALVAKDGRIFVSEIGEFGKDGDGEITMIDTTGKVSVFAVGMDDPKGLAMIGKDLYVADKTRVLKIAPNGTWQVFAGAKDFPVTPMFLNDLTTDIHGNVYVSDSGDLNGIGGAIYKINPEGKVSTVINGKQDPRVLAPNGLITDDTGNILLYVDFASGILYSINMKSHLMVDLASGFGGGDGLVDGPNGVYYLSDWKNGRVFRFKNDEVEMIQDGFKASADITLSQDGKFILVPDMKAGELVWLPVPK